jgi:hypothetical protein
MRSYSTVKWWKTEAKIHITFSVHFTPQRKRLALSLWRRVCVVSRHESRVRVVKLYERPTVGAYQNPATYVTPVSLVASGPYSPVSMEAIIVPVSPLVIRTRSPR